MTDGHNIKKIKSVANLVCSMRPQAKSAVSTIAVYIQNVTLVLLSAVLEINFVRSDLDEDFMLEICGLDCAMS